MRMEVEVPIFETKGKLEAESFIREANEEISNKIDTLKFPETVRANWTEFKKGEEWRSISEAFRDKAEKLFSSDEIDYGAIDELQNDLVSQVIELVSAKAGKASVEVSQPKKTSKIDGGVLGRMSGL